MSTDIFEYCNGLVWNIFKGSPNFTALLKMLCVPIQDRVDVYEYILSMRNIDEKEGRSLDHVGSKIGVRRPLEQEPVEHLFTLYDEWETGDWFDEYTGFGEDDEPELGGFLVDEDGLDTGDGEYMNDADYRVLLKQKAASFRSKMTDENLVAYFLVFGAPVTLDESETLVVNVTPENAGDLTQWERWYIQNKGFKPAGIRVKIDETVGEISL
jgi:hypothetical protein